MKDEIVKGISKVSFQDNKINKKSKRNSINRKIILLRYCSYEECSLGYLRKQLHISRQLCFHYLKELTKQSLLRQNIDTKFYSITPLGIETTRLYTTLSNSKKIPNNLINKYRLHNFKAILRLKDKTNYKELTNINDHIQAVSNIAIIHYSTSIFVSNLDTSFIASVFVNNINNQTKELPCATDSASYYLDVAEIRSKKQLKEDFLTDERYRDKELYWYDCSKGFIEREYNLEWRFL